MNEKTLKATYAGLLHDIGKILCRAHGTQNHSICGYEFLKELLSDEDILAGVRYHHDTALTGDNLSVPARSNAQECTKLSFDSVASASAASGALTDNPIAYLIGMADRITSDSEQRMEGKKGNGAEPNPGLPLSSVFNILNGGNLSYYYKPEPLKEQINYPENKPGYTIPSSNYLEIAAKLKADLEAVNYREEAVNALLAILESRLSHIPSNTIHRDTADIPLYDHSKMTAAIASCISEYLLDQRRYDYRSEFTNRADSFLKEKVFLMFSGDFSGIQSFIYNIVSEGALKSLRSRSFFLELVMEHIVDEVLEAAGVSRANLIYSGGGHCYLLLPNTNPVIERIESLKERLNRWLREGFGTKLYYACAYTECSACDLMNQPAEAAPYEQIFRRLSRKLSQEKIHRYSAKELLELNTPSGNDGVRECRICGTEDHLVKEDNICHWCNSFEKLSNRLLMKDLVILISEDSLTEYPSVTLPALSGEVHCYFANVDEAVKLCQGTVIKRLYTKNRSYPELFNSTKLYMGDYVFDTRIDRLLHEQGMQRIAIMRADVDNLGQAFISGFTRQSDDPRLRNQYNTLSRTAAFSRQMSLFFKYYLNYILAGKDESYHIPVGNEQTVQKKVVTVYAGGDDVFLIGNIRDILETAILIKGAFSSYTCKSLSISFGIGMYPVKYPIYRSAVETEELESLAKENDGKDSISLFTVNEDHTYKLDIFRNRVLEGKLSLLQSFFGYRRSDQERGSTFLYRLMELIKSSEDRINIARYAYLLARLEPATRNMEYKQLYQDFSRKMYGWIMKPEDRKELLTAIYIYIYLTRKRSD